MASPGGDPACRDEDLQDPNQPWEGQETQHSPEVGRTAEPKHTPSRNFISCVEANKMLIWPLETDAREKWLHVPAMTTASPGLQLAHARTSACRPLLSDLPSRTETVPALGVARLS